MSQQEQTFDQLLTSIEHRERKSRHTVVRWTVLPVLAAFAFLGYSSWRLDTASEEVSSLEGTAARYEMQAEDAQARVTQLTARIDEMRMEAETLRDELEQTQELLRQTLEFSQYRFVVDPVDVKAISSRWPEASRILRFIIGLRTRDVGWRLGGRAPDEGFDSPSFAEYVLREFDLGSGEGATDESLVAASRRLYQSLPATDDPRPGDLAFYPSGYVMFYFLAESGEPFVMGMTPFGIAAFKQDFARVIGYRRPTAR